MNHLCISCQLYLFFIETSTLTSYVRLAKWQLKLYVQNQIAFAAHVYRTKPAPRVTRIKGIAAISFRFIEHWTRYTAQNLNPPQDCLLQSWSGSYLYLSRLLASVRALVSSSCWHRSNEDDLIYNKWFSAIYSRTKIFSPMSMVMLHD
jgi:hypothetical protein